MISTLHDTDDFAHASSDPDRPGAWKEDSSRENRRRKQDNCKKKEYTNRLTELLRPCT